MSQLSYNNSQMTQNNGFHASYNHYGTIQDNNRTSYTIPTYVPSQSNSACYFAQESFEIGSPIFLGDESENFSSSISHASKKINKALPVESKVSHRRNKKARNPWTPKEDQKLMELMKKYGQSWAMISSLMEGRTGKQVRDRFLNKLRPNIKCGDWAQHEDELLVRLCKEIGNRWSLIATHLPGRTEGQVKNRYYSHIKKRLLPDGTYCPNLENSSKPTSENVTSATSSPVQEEAAFDFNYDLDFNMLNGCETNYNQTATYNNTKVAYVTEEESYSERNTTQLPSPQSGSESSYQADPTDVISYSENLFYLPRATSFVVPSIENDNHIDEALNTVTNYYMESQQGSNSDVDSFFAGNLSSESSPSSSDERLEQLNRRKMFLEMALASTMKELKNL